MSSANEEAIRGELWARQTYAQKGLVRRLNETQVEFFLPARDTDTVLRERVSELELKLATARTPGEQIEIEEHIERVRQILGTKRGGA